MSKIDLLKDFKGVEYQKAKKHSRSSGSQKNIDWASASVVEGPKSNLIDVHNKSSLVKP